VILIIIGSFSDEENLDDYVKEETSKTLSLEKNLKAQVRSIFMEIG
jgi:hypothetical protein